MIYGIGHDIVENQRIAKLLEKYRDGFVSKILSASEQEVFATHQDKARFLAKRFAAKEAFAKACGTGLRAPILMPSISVVNDSLGKPSFEFDISIQEWLTTHKIDNAHLSLSDEVMLSSGFVVLETK